MDKKSNNLLKKSLLNYFDDYKKLGYLVDMIDKNTKYSLRILEWFVSNYSKKYNISYTVTGKQFNVFIDYKNQLKSYSKKFFDPFKRHEKFEMEYTSKTGEKKVIETTLGQLNFFKWAIETQIFGYLDKNWEDVKKDMNQIITKRTKKEPNSRKKREPLSVEATKSCVKRYTKVIITFE
jgi:hypothetical protein